MTRGPRVFDIIFPNAIMQGLHIFCLCTLHSSRSLISFCIAHNQKNVIIVFCVLIVPVCLDLRNTVATSILATL